MNDAGTLLPTLYAADEAGGWNTGMRAISHAVLAGVAVPSGPQLELGCGGGAFVRELAALAGTDSPVVGLDLPTMTVSLQGPRGNIGDIRAESVENIKKVLVAAAVAAKKARSLVQSAQAAK